MPDGLLLGIRLALAVVFGAAGLAKLRDQAGTRRALADFGVAESLVPSMRFLLPLAELAVAVGLLVTPGVRAGAVGALVLLLLFSVAIAVTLAQGRTPDCHCFGQVHSTPVGRGTLVRNGVLSGLSALLVVGGPGIGLGQGLRAVGDLSAGGRVALVAGLLVAAALVGQGWLLLELMHQQGRLLLRLEALEGSPGLGEGLPLGSEAPDFSLGTVRGESLRLRDLLVPGRVLLAVFVSPSCRPCNELLPELRLWQQGHAALLSIAVLARGDETANRVKADHHGLHPVGLDTDAAVAQAYRALPTPSAVLIDSDGMVRSPVAAGADAIRGLVVRVIDTRAGLVERPAVPALDGVDERAYAVH